MRRSRASLLVAGIVLLATPMVGGYIGSASGATRTSATSAVATATPDQLTLVAFGDSWPNGGHCNGCEAFPARYADGLRQVTGLPVRFVDLTQSLVPHTNRGETPESLLHDLLTNKQVQKSVADADVIMIATGPNDLDDGSLDAYLAGTCGGSDNADCFRALQAPWRASFDAILQRIHAIRQGRPTAIRLVPADDFFISDPFLIDQFGMHFGRTIGAMIMEELATATCQAADAYGAVCVDARKIINGPGMNKPVDENSDASHQAVADALVASGLAELGL